MKSSQPFITLSSDSSASDSFDDSTPLSTPTPSTHDTSRASFHVKDLERFAESLQQAADRAFPNDGHEGNRYSNVTVLLLRWEDDELGVEWELDDLDKVFQKYGFGTEKWLIPRKNAHRRLMSKALEIVEQHDSDDDENDLVIVYYAGHAYINSARQSTWSCRADPSYATLEWSATQTLFEQAKFDVLFLLDCCAAASAVPKVGSGIAETIAACGFESIAPVPGRFSFTNSLIEVLEDWVDGPPFSAAMLHNQVLSVLKHERPERAQNGKRRKLECRRTPIHIVASADVKIPSIELGRRFKPRFIDSQSSTSLSDISRLPKTRLPSGVGDIPSMEHQVRAFNPYATEEQIKRTLAMQMPNYVPSQSGDSPAPSITTGNLLTEENLEAATQQTMTLKRKGYHQDSLDDVVDGQFGVSRVIISLALEENQTLNSESGQKWLASFPALVKYANIEGVYKSFSTLVLLSIPVFIWDFLPDDLGCSFVAYVTSPNMMAPSPLEPEAGIELQDVQMGDVQSMKDSPSSEIPKEKAKPNGFPVNDLLYQLDKIARSYDTYVLKTREPLFGVMEMAQDLHRLSEELRFQQNRPVPQKLGYSDHAAIVRTLDRCAKFFLENTEEALSRSKLQKSQKTANLALRRLGLAQTAVKEDEIRRLRDAIASHENKLVQASLRSVDANKKPMKIKHPAFDPKKTRKRPVPEPKSHKTELNSATANNKLESAIDGNGSKWELFKTQSDMFGLPTDPDIPSITSWIADYKKSPDYSSPQFHTIRSALTPEWESDRTEVASLMVKPKKGPCTYCRKLMLKCDLSTPQCQRCVDAEMHCTYERSRKGHTLEHETSRTSEKRRKFENSPPRAGQGLVTPDISATPSESGDDSSSTIAPSKNNRYKAEISVPWGRPRKGSESSYGDFNSTSSQGDSSSYRDYHTDMDLDSISSIGSGDKSSPQRKISLDGSEPSPKIDPHAFQGRASDHQNDQLGPGDPRIDYASYARMKMRHEEERASRWSEEPEQRIRLRTIPNFRQNVVGGESEASANRWSGADEWTFNGLNPVIPPESF